MINPEFASKLHDAVEKHHAAAIALSDDLFAHPELPHEEFESSRKMVEMLRQHGFEVEYPYDGYPTAFCGVLRNGDGPKVAVLAEYDALPEIGHACGHNLHGAMSILTGLALADMKDHFKGTLYVVGTPAEEENGAKIGMADRGIFDGMDLAMMMHSSGNGVCQAQMDALSLRCYVIEFHGESSHAAASPWAGHSALAAGRKFLDLIDARRECFTPDIRVNAVILDGGKVPGIIPNYTKIRLEFRTSAMGTLKTMDDMILKCARAAAMALDCTVTWEPGLDDFADMVRVPALEDAMAGILTGLGETVIPVQPPVGSTDMGNVSYRCPSLQPLMAITKDNYALHTVEFAEATRKPDAYR
ncbi:amidohydrolase, partial [Desulfovibrio sp. OttesenSCG-928-I05]|nr:amidohydrolase [Desulfovibrio sp. OttesenSCG-928-I05]